LLLSAIFDKLAQTGSNWLKLAQTGSNWFKLVFFKLILQISFLYDSESKLYTNCIMIPLRVLNICILVLRNHISGI